MSDFVEEPVVEEPADAEAPITEAHEEPAIDKWERLHAELGEDFDPELVVKNVKQYTQTHQQLADEKRALEPLRQIQDAFDSDPEFAQHVLAYGKKREEDMTAEELAREALNRVQTQEANFATQRALGDLHDTVKSKGQRDFEDVELLSFAARNRIADLKAAYLLMYEDELFAAREKAVIEQEKSKKQAGVVTKVRESGATNPRTAEDWAKVPDEDFEREYKKAMGQ